MIGKDNGIIIEERGAIIPVAESDEGFKTVMIIESNKGAVRANHWHKNDTHWMYILSGKARYLEEQHGILVEQIMLPGDKVFTAAGIPHAMEFLEDTKMIVCAKNPRDYDTYMADIEKCEII